MADVLERAGRRSAPRSDARETLEPLLDELMRSLGFERAAVLLYDEDRAALAGSFGIGVPDAIARELVIPLALADDPIVAVLRGGLPARIRDATTDERISPAIRNTLAQARLGPIVAAPLRSTTEGGQVRPDGKGSATAGWEHRGEWAGVVLLSRRSGVTQSDVDALVPFARQAEEALSQQRDVDLLRDTSEAHAIEKEWLWWMVNGVGDAVLVTDSNNDMVLQNRGAELLFRAGDEDSAGKRHAVWMNNFLFTAALSTWNLERIGATTSREVTLVDPIEGEELIYEVITTPATNFRVGMRGTVSVLKNVTEIRHSGEELVRGQERLAPAEEEVRPERARPDPILRNAPNATIVVDNDQHIIAAAGSDRDYLDIAVRETQRMSRILRQMLGFYRQAEAVSDTDVNALIEEAAGLVGKRLRERGVQVVRELDARLPRIRASADQLKQVVLNLLLNAADSMPKGGTITVLTTAGGASEAEVVGRAAVQIQVRDTGDGIPDDVLAQIFEPFFSTKPGKGTGLGLWVSQGIVQSHGGTMRVRSRLGRGTTFMITLPVQGPPSDARAA